MQSSNTHTIMRRRCRHMSLWEVEDCSVLISVHLAAWNCDREEATSNVRRQSAAWIQSLHAAKLRHVIQRLSHFESTWTVIQYARQIS